MTLEQTLQREKLIRDAAKKVQAQAEADKQRKYTSLRRKWEVKREMKNG